MGMGRRVGGPCNCDRGPCTVHFGRSGRSASSWREEMDAKDRHIEKLTAELEEERARWNDALAKNRLGRYFDRAKLAETRLADIRRALDIPGVKHADTIAAIRNLKEKYELATDEIAVLESRLEDVEKLVFELQGKFIAEAAKLVRLVSPDALPKKWGEMIPREPVVDSVMRLKDAFDRAYKAVRVKCTYWEGAGDGKR